MSVLPMEAATVVAPEPDQWLPTRDWSVIQANLTEAIRGMRARRGDIETYWAYYDGDHTQVWYNDALRKAFGAKGMNDLQDNYCALVVNAPLARLAVQGWAGRTAVPQPDDTTEQPADQAAAAAVAQWEANDMELEQDDVMRAALVVGLSFVLVWPETDDQGQQVTDENGLPAFDVITKDARNVYVATGHKLRSRKWAAQVFLDTDRWRATLFYSDQDGKPAEVVRLHTPPTKNVSREFPQQARRFVLDADDPGGDMPEVFGGKCPVVPFRLDRAGKSWLRDAVPVQDKINKLAANKMVAAEFLAFPQRYILTDQDIEDGALRYSPAKVLQLDPGGLTDETTGEVRGKTQVGEFSTADLEVYDKAKSAEVDTLFTIKLLPRHLRVNPGTAPSGTAITADEGPHVSFVQLCQRMFGASWQDVQQLMGNDVVPVWSEAKVANEEAAARTLADLVRAGVPLIAALRWIGWSDEQIKEAEQQLADLQAQAVQLARAQALMVDQGRDPNEAAADDGLALDKRVTMAGVLIRSGYDPVSVTSALDLPPDLVHTGGLPTTVRTPEQVNAEDAKAQAEVQAAPTTPPQEA